MLREAEPGKTFLLDLLSALVEEDEAQALEAFEKWEGNLPNDQNHTRYSEITEMGFNKWW